MLGLCQPLASQNYFELSRRIATGTDDAEERQSGGTIDITSSDIELVFDGSTVGNQTVGLRFTNIQIPKDAIILGAWIQFWVDENTHTAATNLTIRGEASDNSATFSTIGFNVSSRRRTTAAVAWNNLPLWTVLNAAGNDQRSPDVKSVVEEVMGRSGWKQGNAVTFLINGTGRRNAHAFEGSATMAPQLIIRYMPSKAPVTAYPVTKGDVWMYNDSGLNLGTSWKDIQYSDSTWPFFMAKFGYGEGNERTVLSYGSNPSLKHMTTYFRKRFTVTDSASLDSLIFRILADDGAVVYLNGTEIFRRNMPTGTINWMTAAVASVYGNDEATYFEHRVGAKLRNGENLLAVEIHQNDPESVDLGFDLELIAKKPRMKATGFPLRKGSEWYFNDKGVDLYGTNWTDSIYAGDNDWDYGTGPLGYGDPMSTVISFGPNSANKHVAYFFRKQLFIPDTSLIKADFLDFNIRRDDGAVVFVNGVEVLRQNMPSGPLNNRTISSTIVDGSNETTYFTTTLPKSVFRNGINQIAVGMHQRDSISSDLGFDMEIIPRLRPNPPAMGCVDGNTHIGCFTSITPQAQINRLVMPQSHAFQQMLKQGTPYTMTSGTVPTNHDFTAYVGRNGSSRDGVVCVNHENTPGGVSLMYTRYVDTLMTWVVDSINRVDFYNSHLVTTARNCSGGITPWGTVITSEETFNASDANNDGYQDAGWNVEYNPWTGKVIDYGNGKPEKLWAMGRMSHENVVVANDSVTVYQGEDGGTHLVYKFVADRPGYLYSGKLYVLRLNQPLISGEPTGTTGRWIRVPNTTQADRNNCNAVALAVGGTQFSGVEDVEIGTLDGKIYFTAKGLNRTYRFKDADTTFSEFETFVGGKSYNINNGSSSISEPWGSGNDNLTFDEKGNLWVLQDGSRNYVWMVRKEHTQDEPKVELFMSPPLSSEPTGMTFTPDHRFMFMSIQHPSSSNIAQVDATGRSVDFKQAATVVVARKEYLGVPRPTPVIKADTTVIRAGHTVRFEDQSYPLIWNRTWYFEGIGMSNLKNPVITYPDTGVFAVKLVVSNRSGKDSVEYLRYITVVPDLPEPAFESDVREVYEGETVHFTDRTRGRYNYRQWEFEGGNPVRSNDSLVAVTYPQMGLYRVTLRTGLGADTISLSEADFIRVLRRKPVADFYANNMEIIRGDSVVLTDASKNLVEFRQWETPGAKQKAGPHPDQVVLVYNSTGTYPVTLRVRNAGGADTLTRLAYILVKPRKPEAGFSATKTTVVQGNTVRFIDMSTEEIQSRVWEFPGGAPAVSSDLSPSVVYNQPGLYDAKLTVYNASGQSTLLKRAYVEVSGSTHTEFVRDVAGFTLFPNPIGNQLHCDLELFDNAPFTAELQDIQGRLIQVLETEKQFAAGRQVMVWNLSALQLTAGTYTLRLQIGSSSISRIIVKS